MSISRQTKSAPLGQSSIKWKTEGPQRLVPLDTYLARALRSWRRRTRFRGPEDWVFASPFKKGRKPYRGQTLMRRYIQPAGRGVGITKRIGWHTFRHTCSTLLRAAGVDIKVMQELLRHASSRVTMDTYTKAVTSAKRQAQSAVVRLLQKGTESEGAPAASGASEDASSAPIIPFCADDGRSSAP